MTTCYSKIETSPIIIDSLSLSLRILLSTRNTSECFDSSLPLFGWLPSSGLWAAASPHLYCNSSTSSLVIEHPQHTVHAQIILDEENFFGYFSKIYIINSWFFFLRKINSWFWVWHSRSSLFCFDNNWNKISEKDKIKFNNKHY